MKKFLEKVAELILEKSQKDLLTTAIIFPNKRSEVFLKDHLKKKTTQSLWLPEMYTIDEFVVKASGLNEIDPVQIYFELFEIHKKLAGDDAREIEDFLSWAPIMLSDFNDIDNYLANPESIFSHLSEMRAMEEWNVDQKPLTDLQKNYLRFYNSLIDYYKLLHENLRLKNSAFKGMMYRSLAENVKSVSVNWPWKQFILVGFNALSESEKKLFDYLNSNFETDFLWDIDAFFMTKEGKMEAGHFIARMLDRWKLEEPRWIEDKLLNDTKKIEVLGTSKRIGQVKYTGNELESRFKNSATETTDTAVVLADENLLVPLLNSLPVIKNERGETIGYNITMGYPVSNGPFSQFISDWLELLIFQNEQVNQLFSSRHFISILNNPVVKITVDQEENSVSETLKNHLLKGRFSYFSEADVIEFVRKQKSQAASEVIKLLLLEDAIPTVFIESLIKILGYVKQALTNSDGSHFLLKEQLVLMIKLTKKLQGLVEINSNVLNLKALQKIVIQLIRRSEVNLKGEPLSGIQVMGMLETRNLDFKNIILLSANEGVLPKSDRLESFIPFDIRSAFKLPLPKDKTDVYAYHFYRLLIRAENITLVYNSESGQLGGGEQSRYILQLKSELAKLNPNIKIEEKLIDFPPPESRTGDKIEITKDKTVMDLIYKKLDSGLSPSSLSTFINCPLQYYFSKLLGLRIPEDLDKSIESDVFGSVVHGVLEDLYKDFVGTTIDADKLSQKLDDLDLLLQKHFKDEYEGGDLSSGKNFLTLKVARKYIQQFVKRDIIDLKKQARQLMAVEKEIQTTLELNGKTVLLRGFIDRIDTIDDHSPARLIDYKTGAVESKDLKLTDWDEMIIDPKHQKVFQLLFYTYLFEASGIEKNPEAGIFSLRKVSGGFIMPTLPDKASWEESKDTFESLLKELIGVLINPDLPFKQTEDEKNCNWCDFKNICNRHETNNF
jgi:CRISPR/Cas system-associated exonuclease Cas4 (RecB family)